MADFLNDALAALYRGTDAVSTVYLDCSAHTSAPKHALDHQHDAVRQALARAGAPAADQDAIEELLEPPTGVSGAVSRFLIVQNGRVEVDELLPGEPLDEGVSAYGPVPKLVPLLRHRPKAFSYVVAEVGRDGGEIRLYRHSQVRPLSERVIEGDTEYLTKVHTGGWSQERYQRDAEETWKRNEGQLAEAIDQVVRDNAAELLIVSGDVRARQLLIGQLSPASRAVLAVVSSHTRPEGASAIALEEDLQRNITEILVRDKNRALERLAAEAGRNDGLSENGISGVIPALQRSQVDTLVVAPGSLAGRTLVALTREPWVTEAAEDGLGAEELARVEAVDALVRAAVLTKATVVIAEPAEIQSDEGVAALLRWPSAPLTPAA